MNQVNKLESLLRSPLGKELDAAEGLALADRMGIRTVQDSEMLVCEGDACRTLFLLASGALDLRRRNAAGEDESVFKMRVGDCVGSRAFVEGSPYMFGLRSVGVSTVLTLEPADLESLHESHSWLPYKIMRALLRIAHGGLMSLYLESTELRNYMMKTGGRY
jgi:CRP/FNR family transcriptional regulator, cyclic AMP receptor protein